MALATSCRSNSETTSKEDSPIGMDEILSASRQPFTHAVVQEDRAMKITNVVPWIVDVPVEGGELIGTQGSRAGRPRRARQYVFVQVETDEGITGWGEITTYPGPVANRAVCAVLREVGPLVQGQDAGHI